MNAKFLFKGDYLVVATNMVKDWSEARSGSRVNGTPVDLFCSPSLPLMKQAYSWIKSDPFIVEQEEDGFTFALTTASNHRLTHARVKKYASETRFMRWKKFDDFVSSDINVHRIKFSADQCISEYLCSCPQFFKTYICKHAIGFARSKDKLTFPPEAIAGGLGSRRGPGRPRKHAPALERD